MSLTRMPLRASRPQSLCARYAATASINGPAPKIQLKKPAGEEGFFSYTRNWSRDKNLLKYANPPQKGDLPSRFLFRRLGHAYELYPLVFLLGFWVTVFGIAAVWSFEKMEIWLDKTQGVLPPGDWERVRSNYWKQHTLAYDPKGITHQRLDIMETLEDEMLEAAKKRGTR